VLAPFPPPENTEKKKLFLLKEKTFSFLFIKFKRKMGGRIGVEGAFVVLGTTTPDDTMCP